MSKTTKVDELPEVSAQGPLPLVGMPVQYYTTHEHRIVQRMGQGPYAAIITEVTDSDAGLVCLFVRPPMAAGYDVANVKYGPIDEAVEDGEDDSWLTATFYG